MHELWPPKPNELEIAALMAIFSFVAPTIKLVSTSSSGVSKLRFGCT